MSQRRLAAFPAGGVSRALVFSAFRTYMNAPVPQRLESQAAFKAKRARACRVRLLACTALAWEFTSLVHPSPHSGPGHRACARTRGLPAARILSYTETLETISWVYPITYSLPNTGYQPYLLFVGLAEGPRVKTKSEASEFISRWLLTQRK